MREIKFRIYNHKTKSWIHGPHEKSCLDGINLFGETILLGHLLDGVSIEDLNEIEALQYTGLEDKNGKEIFEGDLLKISDADRPNYFKDYCHVWYSDSGCFNVSFNHMYSETSCELYMVHYTYEVIGNVYDNPDLLK